MRRLIAVAVLAVVITIPCIAGNCYIGNFEEELSSIMQQTYDAISREDYESASKLADSIEQKFTDKEKIIAIFTDHELVEELGYTISRLRPLAAEETKAEFKSELASARVMLTHVVNDQRPVINNIF